MALSYAQRGWRVFPCKPKEKLPLTSHGFKDATSNTEQIAGWWKRWPDANIGIATGAASGFVAIDLDGEEGLRSWEHIPFKYGAMPETLSARTGGGGRHLLFTHPGGHTKIKNQAGRLGAGVDIRGDGGYIVVAPSVHPSGGHYEWENDAELAPIPPSLLRALEERQQRDPTVPISTADVGTQYGQKALDNELAVLRRAAEGTRNDVLNQSAFSLGQLVGGEALNVGDVETHLLATAVAIGLTETEARATIRSGLEAGMQKPRRAPERTPIYTAAVTARPRGKLNVPRAADDLLRNPPMAPPAFTDPPLFVRDGIQVLAAPTKVGKTNLWLHIAWALTEGVKLFNFLDVPEPVNVLLLELELSQRVVHDRIASLRKVLPWNAGLARFSVWCGRSFLLDQKDGASSLAKIITDCPLKPDFVILDSYNAAISGDPDRSGEARRGLHALRSVQESLEVSFGITSEIRKQPPGMKLRYDIDDLKGSNELAYDADTVIMLRPIDEFRRQLALRFPAVRHVAEELPDDLVLIRKGLTFELTREKDKPDADLECCVRDFIRDDRTGNTGVRDVREHVRASGIKAAQTDIDAVRRRVLERLGRSA